MFASKYFNRYNVAPKYLDSPVDKDLEIVVVIPCYDDNDIFETLNSLEKAYKPNCFVEVLIVVNSSEIDGSDIIGKNRAIYERLQVIEKSNLYKNFKLLSIKIENVPKKIAGVGNARKIGMDEAIRRLDTIENKNGVIISLDSDSIVDEDYFLIIEQSFKKDKLKAITLNFQHHFNGFSQEIITACCLYEIYLRYFRICLVDSGFPYSFFTIGSCFAINAETYIKTGGMPRLQAGEDFYFLHKVAQTTQITQIKDKLVFPSPRISHRVPFGTGKAVGKIIADNYAYMAYSLESFDVIKRFFAQIPRLYKSLDVNFVPYDVIMFFGREQLINKMLEIKNNSNGLDAFTKRFFATFDAFFVIKLLNHIADLKEVISQAKQLLTNHNISFKDNIVDIHSKIDKLDRDL